MSSSKQQAQCHRLVPVCQPVQVGLLISAPLFAEASKHYPALRLMAFGLGAWILSTAGCALSFGQPSLLASPLQAASCAVSVDAPQK